MKLGAMDAVELLEDRAPGAGEGDDDLAAVFVGGGAFREAECLEAVNQADGAVVGDLEPLGKFADGDPVAPGEAFDREERLILLGLETVRAGCPFAEAEEHAQCVSEFCEQLVVGFGER